MTALVDTGHVPDKNFPFNFHITDSRFTSQAFGRELNALPKLCNCYAYSTIKAPDKGEVGGSSPPRPTIFPEAVSHCSRIPWLCVCPRSCLQGMRSEEHTSEL